MYLQKQQKKVSKKSERKPMTKAQMKNVKGGLGASTYPRWERALTTWVWE